MGVKGNLIGHTGYIESDTAVYLQTRLGDIGSTYQPIYLQRQEGTEKGVPIVCEYNDIYYNLTIGPFTLQDIPEFEEYPYVCDFMDSRITNQTYAQCILNAEDAGSGIISPIIKTFESGGYGMLRMYASQELDSLTIQTLALFNLHRTTNKAEQVNPEPTDDETPDIPETPSSENTEEQEGE